LHRHHGHNAALKATDFDAVCGMESNYCRVTGYSEVWSGPQQKSNRRSFVAVLLRMTAPVGSSRDLYRVTGFPEVSRR
jgi:hypothetical protein